MTDQALLETTVETLLQVVPPLYRRLQALRLVVGREWELSRGQMDVLLALYRKNFLTLTELSQQMAQAKSNVTIVIDDLVARGLVKKTGHPSDGRAVVLSMTEQGSSMHENIRRLYRKYMAQSLASFDGGQLRRLLDGLDTLEPLAGLLDHLSGVLPDPS